jgi:S-DNA-T family DNA segregation ATPase FtsK/SpoIIIE
MNTVRKRKVEIPRHRAKKEKAEAAADESSRGLVAETIAVCLLAGGVFLAAALVSHFQQLANAGRDVVVGSLSGNLMGRVGEISSRYFDSLLGWCSFVVVLWALLLARTVWVVGWPLGNSSLRSLVNSVVGSALMAASCAAICSLFFGYEGGGLVGSKIAYTLVRYVNEPGTLLICLAVFLLSFGIATDLGVSRIFFSFRVSLRFLRTLISDSYYFCTSTARALFNGEVYLGRVLIASTVFFVRLFGRLLYGIFVAPVLLLFRRPVARRVDAAVSPVEDQAFVLGDVAASEKRARRQAAERVSEKEPTTNQHAGARLRISRGKRPVSDGGDGRGKKRLKQLLTTRRAERKKRSAERALVDAAEELAGSKDFELPTHDLLVSGESRRTAGPKDEDLIRNSAAVERTLSDFNISGRVVEAHPGPVITLYEFEPAAGVKVQRIINLADDLALGLKVASVRVYAPVPGKGTVGIEVPNAEREIVRLRDVLDCQEMLDADSGLALALGKDTFGQPSVADLGRMPHLLIAGATGTGKSVCLNSLILTLLYRNTPETLRFIMIDPKMLELSIYEGIPHLKAPVVTNPKHARGVLWWAVEEMERRYRLMMGLGVRHVLSYNTLVSSQNGAKKNGTVRRSRRDAAQAIELREMDVVATSAERPVIDRRNDTESELTGVHSGKTKHEPLPRIVIVVDELADLMLTVGREVEELLTRLAQKARAAGIHLILATQRPSVNVITGLIKANFPARISFQVASRIDARTVLDTSGAEKLLGQGDMLFLNPGRGGVKRLHSAFVSDKEVQDVVEWVRGQGLPDYDTEIEQVVRKLDEADKGGVSDAVEGEQDPLYDQAVAIIVEKGHGSTSMIQRVFRIGYNRAARILEAMEREGVVGPADGAKPRQVLVPNRDHY